MPTILTKRILVVDNEPASTRLVRLVLERHCAFEICEVNDSRGALAAARLFKPDLTLLDVEMPGLDGGAVARQLREDVALAHVPIIFMTSLLTEEEAAHRIFSGGSRVLAKPVTMTKLVQCVGEMLGTLCGEERAGHLLHTLSVLRPSPNHEPQAKAVSCL